MTQPGPLEVAPSPPAEHTCNSSCEHALVAEESMATRSVRRLVSTPLGLAVLFVGAVLAVDAGGTDEGPGLCVFRRCTGGYCPGCGITRAARHMTRGEVGASWRDHPWVALVAVQAAVVAGIWGIARMTARRVDWARPMRLLAVANVVALVAIWIIRLTNGSIPRFF